MRFLRAGLQRQVSEVWEPFWRLTLGMGRVASCLVFCVSLLPRKLMAVHSLSPQEPGCAHPGGAVPPSRLLHLCRLRAELKDARALLGGGRAVLREARPPALLCTLHPQLPSLSASCVYSAPLQPRPTALCWHLRARAQPIASSCGKALRGGVGPFLLTE